MPNPYGGMPVQKLDSLLVPPQVATAAAPGRQVSGLPTPYAGAQANVAATYGGPLNAPNKAALIGATQNLPANDQAFKTSTGPAPVQNPFDKYFMDPNAGWTPVGTAPLPPNGTPGGQSVYPGNATPGGGGGTAAPAAAPAPQPGAVAAPRPEDAINPGAGARPVAQGIAAQQADANRNIQAMQNGIPSSQGAGQGAINTVNSALTAYNPNFAIQPGGAMQQAPGTVSMGGLPGNASLAPLPGTGAMGALPGTVAGAGPLPGVNRLGALPGTVQQGALPGATDRNLQLSQLDRIVGYNPETASRAEALLGDATQNNLSSSLALARSARGGPAAQAQALRVAQGEGAATMSQSARDLSALRAQEEDTAKGRELSALGLGNEAATGIRGADVGERGQNIEALDAALSAGVEQRGQTTAAQSAELQAVAAQRGQTVQSLMNDVNAGVTQRGQTIGALETERNAGVGERGQTIGALEAALSGDVTQRGQTIGAQEANLNAGVTQRGQTVEQQIAERNAGVSERGQTLDTQEAQKRAELDALLGRSGLAQTTRNAAVTERGQTLDATMQGEQIKTARDTIAASALTDSEKIASTELLGKVQAGYQPTQAEKIELMKLADKLGEPGLFQSIMGGVQAIGTLGAAGAMIFSDIRAKTDISPTSALDELKNAPSYNYNYKPGMGPPGRFTGPMAQDLEGTGAVHDTPNGKAIDPNRLALVNASAIGELGNKLDHVLTGGAPADVAGSYGTGRYARDLAAGQADASSASMGKLGKASSLLSGLGPSPADLAAQKRKKMDELLRVAGL